MIPIKCFTCGTVLADSYRTFKETVRALKQQTNEDVDKINYLTVQNCEKSIEGQKMDDLNIVNPCCRTIFLTHTDI
jgi:DNA-directed RNA polymerase subunit N (RpoN/RPB10)